MKTIDVAFVAGILAGAAMTSILYAAVLAVAPSSDPPPLEAPPAIRTQNAPAAPVLLHTKADRAVYNHPDQVRVGHGTCRALFDNMPMGTCDPLYDPPCTCGGHP